MDVIYSKGMDLRHCASTLNDSSVRIVYIWSAEINRKFCTVDLKTTQSKGHQEPAHQKYRWPQYEVLKVICNYTEEVAIRWTQATEFVTRTALFKEEHCSTGFKVQDGDRAAHWSSRTVQTAHANKRSHTAFSCGRAEEAEGGKAAGPALNMGKFGERGRQVKKSQQESSLDDRRNLISKIHKSSTEGSRTMDTKEASVRVNIDLLLAIKWIGPSC